MFKSGFSILALIVFGETTEVFNGVVGPPTTWVALTVGHGQRCTGLATGIPIKVSGFFSPRRGGSIFEATIFPVVGHVIWKNSCGDAMVAGPFDCEKTVPAVVRIFFSLRSSVQFSELRFIFGKFRFLKECLVNTVHCGFLREILRKS